MKNLLSIIAAVILGIIAVLAVQSYINKQAAKYRENKTDVAVAAYLIEENTIIQPDMIAKLSIDIKGKTRDMVSWSEARSLLNRTVQKTVNPGEIFLWSQIGEEIPKEIIAQKVEKGSRALTLGVSGISAVMDMIHPNDQVDLIGTFAIPRVEMRTVPMPDGQIGKMEVETQEEASFVLLQNVTVLAVGQRYDREATGGNLTVLVTPEEAIYLIFAAQNGRITSILRNPEDVSDLTDIQVINYEKMLDMAALEGLNEKRKQKIIEEIKGGVAKEELIDIDE
ncbi:MAG: Flp pilus assembly protein CpaB [Candidatus Aureabacteria bacterium]|nr:Flp pilus assembly protein CpaB [Candidatus Auribacterota bacterium]